MNEIIIELEEIAPKEFFGAQNVNIELLKKYFPKLKIVARGNEIKAFGEEELLEEFDRRITMLLKHYAKYNKLDFGGSIGTVPIQSTVAPGRKLS